MSETVQSSGIKEQDNNTNADGTPKIPIWDDMPKPTPILTLSWEDIWGEAVNVTKSKFGRMPTKEEIKELFEITMQRGMDCESDSFWGRIQYEVSEYYSDKSE